MAIAQVIRYAHIDDLLLDPKNPRLGRRRTNATMPQPDVLEIIRGWELDELAVSFIESGFWPQEAVVTVLDPEVDEVKLVVAEGNRRLGALKLLQAAVNGEPRTRKWREYASELSSQDLFARIPYLHADSRDDVAKYLGFRHVTGIKEWAPAEKAEYMARRISAGCDGGE